MAAKEEIEQVSLAITEALFQHLSYVVSPALSREISMRVLVEAKATGQRVILNYLKGDTRAQK